MENSIKSKSYWTKLLPIIIWHILYLVFCKSFDKYTRVYFDLAFYFGISVYFFMLRDWRFSEWSKALKKGKSFWFPTLLTVLSAAVTFGIVGIGVMAFFPNTDDGMGVLGVNSWGTLIAFAFVSVFLAPIAEEAFYRKAVIAFDSKAVIIITCAVSVSLYASEHSLVPLGFLQACLWAVPFNIAYITPLPNTRHYFLSFRPYASLIFPLISMDIRVKIASPKGENPTK